VPPENALKVTLAEVEPNARFCLAGVAPATRSLVGVGCTATAVQFLAVCPVPSVASICAITTTPGDKFPSVYGPNPVTGLMKGPKAEAWMDAA
jgi:hypothetical protein